MTDIRNFTPNYVIQHILFLEKITGKILYNSYLKKKILYNALRAVAEDWHGNQKSLRTANLEKKKKSR